MSTVGHNSKTSFAAGQLKSLVERIERLEEEKKTIAGDIKEVFFEAKSNGFNTKIMRKVISLRKKDRNEREEEEALIDLYCEALGMQASFDFEKSQTAAPLPSPVRGAGTGEEVSRPADPPPRPSEPEFPEMPEVLRRGII